MENFSCAASAHDWAGYQSPSEAVMNLMTLYGWKLRTWRPNYAEWFKGSDDPSRLFLRMTCVGRPDYTVEQWLVAIKRVEQA